MEERGELNMEFVRDYWAVIVGFVGLIVWGARLEAGMNQNTAEIKRLWTQRHDDLENQATARKEANAILTRMDEKMDSALVEIRGDIKAILRETRK